MLRLTRKENQRIKIGSDIIIQVLKIDRRTVELGIAAPKHIEVDREEIWDAKHDKYDHKDK